MRYLKLLFLVFIIFSSCKSSKVAVNQPMSVIDHENKDVAAYVKKYATISVSEMQRTGIPASITLAQGIIESDYGRSRLAREANNHFGIKCHRDWTGRTIYHDDDRRNECFRSYKRAEDSYLDHSDFLTNGSRYDFLFDLKSDDYKSWAKGLKKAGYATNPKYAGMLIDMIEENELYLYDRMAMGKKVSSNLVSSPVEETVILDNTNDDTDGSIDNFRVTSSPNRKGEKNRIQYIIVREGDTFDSLAEEFDLLSWELARYNDLDGDIELTPGQLLYLQPKRLKAEPGNEFHTLAGGETMHSVSQLYGIKLRTLYERNKLDPGTEPPPGTELWLRKTKPDGIR